MSWYLKMKWNSVQCPIKIRETLLGETRERQGASNKKAFCIPLNSICNQNKQVFTGSVLQRPQRLQIVIHIRRQKKHTFTNHLQGIFQMPAAPIPFSIIHSECLFNLICQKYQKPRSLGQIHEVRNRNIVDIHCLAWYTVLWVHCYFQNAPMTM